MSSFHHGITAQELNQGNLPMRNAQISVIGLVAISDDADNDMYPLDTPVLLAGITKDNIDKAGANGTLRSSLQSIRDIHSPTLVVLRVSDPTDVDALDVLLTCKATLGVTPKRLGAPEIDTPAVTRKLVSIAKRRRSMVYAQPRSEDGSLITDTAQIVAYRDTFGDRELCLIENGWGTTANSVKQNKVLPTQLIADLSHRATTNQGYVVTYQVNDEDPITDRHFDTDSRIDDVPFAQLLEISLSKYQNNEGWGVVSDLNSDRNYIVGTKFLEAKFDDVEFGQVVFYGLSESESAIKNEVNKLTFLTTTDKTDDDIDLVEVLFGGKAQIISCAINESTPLEMP